MALKGIDIYGGDKGIDLSKVPCDFVICKATQGASFVSDDFTRQAKQALSQNKLLGVYHYINGIDAIDEMNHFYKTIKPYIGKAIVVLDWEKIQNSAWRNEAYLEKCIKKIIELTGVVPMIYASLAYFPWSLCKKYGCSTWVAQYANSNTTGYQDTPWNEGAYTCDIRQYSENGKLSGWNGFLDLNKAYLNKTEWNKLAKSSNKSTASKPATSSSDISKMSVSDLAWQVLQGKYGTLDTRKKKLGSRYNEVQSFINHTYSASTMTLTKETLQGKYGNGDKRKALLGNKYKSVQNLINYIANTDAATLAKETIKGAYGNGDDRRILLGDRYDEVMKIVNKIA